jgi:hypothetical protein
MANGFNGFLDNLGRGTFNPKGNLGDFQHAARLYVDDYFRLAPKSKFLYHVFFGINPSAVKSLNLLQRHRTEIGMLVKSVDLPKFQIKTENQVNQYNRKKNVKLAINYEPVNIKFHDDNLGVTSQLWQNYYQYYFADHNLSSNTAAYSKNQYSGPARNQFRYGLDNNISVPFFNDITIYQLARQTYQSYTLINPIINSWNHDNMDQSQDTGVTENTMTVLYEAVYYNQGRIDGITPPGFGQDHYDRTPSPLGIAGGGTATLFGPGGVVAGATDVFGSVISGEAFSSPGNLLETIIKAKNTYENSKDLSREGIRQEGARIATGALNEIAKPPVSGVPNSIFPRP